MPDIKTKAIIKGTIKTLDKSAAAAERVTDEAFFQFRRKGQNGFRDAKRNIDNVKSNVQKLRDIKSKV